MLIFTMNGSDYIRKLSRGILNIQIVSTDFVKYFYSIDYNLRDPTRIMIPPPPVRCLYTVV